MPRLFCCHFRQSSSSSLPNTRAVDPSKQKTPAVSRISVASISTTSISRGLDDSQAIRQIFESARDEGARGPLRSSSISDITRKVRKRLSRDSGISKPSSKKKLRSSISLEDLERRRELKRALHQRLQKDLLNDRTPSEGGYDADAVPIATPNVSKGRNGASIRLRPKHFNEIVKHFRSSLSLEKQSCDQELTHGYELRVAPALPESPSSKAMYPTNDEDCSSARIFEPTLTSVSPTGADNIENASLLDSRPVDNLQVLEHAERLGPISLLERSGAARQISRPNLTSQPCLGCIDLIEPSTDLLSLSLQPLSIKPIADPTMQDRLHTFFIPGRTSSVPPRSVAGPLVEDTHENVAVQPEQWLKGASGRLSPSNFHDVSINDSSIKPGLMHAYGSRCDPASEESDFGGVDGEGDSSCHRAYDTWNTRAGYCHTSERVPSIHLYDMHIPQRLISKSLHPSVSLSQLETVASRQRAQSSGSSSRQLSSSGPSCRQYPLSWAGPKQGTTSSVYTSNDESPAFSPVSSRHNSVYCTTNFQGRIGQPNNVVMKKGTTDIWNIFRRGRIDTSSFESSTESFRARELAAAESRIVALPMSLSSPKISRFKEELREFPLVGSLRNRRSMGQSIRRRETASLDGSNEWYLSGKRRTFGNNLTITADGEDALNMWERALQDNAKDEEASEMLTGLHGLSKEIGRESLRKRSRISRSPLVEPRILTEAQGNTDTISGPATRDSSQGSKDRQSKRSVDSWSKFPSHSRADRSSSPAGDTDLVFARDFAAESDLDKRALSKPRRVFSLSGKQKSRSMTFGRSMIKRLSTWYRSPSTDKMFGAGHRSSISVGGVLEYPELEMLPPRFPLLHSPHHSPLHLSLHPSHHSHSHSHVPLPDTTPTVSARPRITVSTASEDGLLPTRTLSDEPHHSAKVWSNMYEECVQNPHEADGESISRASVFPLHAVVPLECSEQQERRNTSSHLSADMRASTLDFKKSLEIDQMKAKERALRAANEAWRL